MTNRFTTRLAPRIQPKLVDFGVARLTAGENRPESTGPGMAVGTPAYMSPEQATGDDVVDPRSDLYALGIISPQNPILASSTTALAWSWIFWKIPPWLSTPWR